jgi:Arc/MetJ family transcription regulator
MPISSEHIEMSTPTMAVPVPNGEVTAAVRTRAVRAIASAAKDAGDCAALLDMLGLSAEDGHPSTPAPRSEN